MTVVYQNSLGNRNLTIRRRGELVEELTETLNFNDEIFQVAVSQIDNAEVQCSLSMPALEAASFKRVAISADYSTLVGDKYIAVDTTDKVTITLHAGTYEGERMIIKDELGNAAARPITLIVSGSGLIDNKSQIKLQINYIAVQLIYTNTQWRLV